MGIFGYVLEIILTAGTEELIKAFIVLLFFETKFKIPSLFLFAVVEAAYYANPVYEHNIELGLNYDIAIIATIFMLIGSKSFHVMTSLIYLKVKFKCLSILSMVIIHSMINFYVDTLSTLNVLFYNIGGWFISGMAGLLIYMYFIFDRHMSTTYKSPLK